MRYSAFISYNHRDRVWAGWLHRELERYRIPKALIGRESAFGPLTRNLPPVFQDREELAASTSLASSVREALAQSHNLIVICSKAGAESLWVNEEVREFAALGRGDRIRCLIVPEHDAPHAAPLDTSRIIPPALLELGGEPLAADARIDGDGKRQALLKLIAGMLGVRYDELRQREQARRQKRLIALATVASIGFMVMSGLTLFALLSRAEAVRERDLARQKTITAQRTTDFVKGLFEVSDPSEARGEQITALEMLDRGAREIQAQLNDEPDVKAELVSTLSEVYMGLGSLRRADDLVRRSLALQVAWPETRARQLSVLARSQFLQADYAGAEATLARALRFANSPGGLRDPRLYSQLLVLRADTLSALERTPESMAALQQALAWDRRQFGPRSPEVAADLESAGLTAQSAGDLAGSRRYYQRALALRLSLHGKLHPKVAEDLNNLGTAAYLEHDPAAAEHYWQQALPIRERLLGPDHPDLATTFNNLARVKLEQRKFASAEPLLVRAANIYLQQRRETHDDLAFILSNLALAKAGVGKTAEALPLFDRALRAANTHQTRARAPIMVDIANLKCARGEAQAAVNLYAAAGPIMRADYPNDAWRTAWLDNSRGACLFRQGEAKEARQLIESTSPTILKRWPLQSLFGFEVQRRQRMLRPKR